jgi:hypothetical protein
MAGQSPVEMRSSGATIGELGDYYPVVRFHFDQPSQIGLINVKHLLLGPIRNYDSPDDILDDSRYYSDVPLNEQVVLEMDSQGLYFIAAVQFSNGSQGVYSNVIWIRFLRNQHQKISLILGWTKARRTTYFMILYRRYPVRS